MNSRSLAALVLVEVLDRGITLDHALKAHGDDLPPRDQAFLQELCYGVLRWLPRLRYQLGLLLQKPLKTENHDIECLLLNGLYQILYLRTPDHAAVSACVDSSRELNKAWAGKLVNAVLRRAIRERETLENSVADIPAALYAHPKWLLKRLQKDWPEDWQQIVNANNQRAPLCVRVNSRRTGRDSYAAALRDAGLASEPHDYAPEALIVTPAVTAEMLPGFSDGLVSVQDAAAQLATDLLDLQPGQRVLDACAAPGGKTAHILEHQPQLGELVAVESSADRLQRLRGGLERLQLHAELVHADARRPQEWWDGTAFDRILLDAPCTGTGVIRRHPDIKYHRDARAVETAVELQHELLTALWPLLALGGKLLYATCSVLPAENMDMISAFLDVHPDAREVPIATAWGRVAGAGRQILPGDTDMDGFFYACLSKH